jgi:UDP-N-acetylmuramoyl-L-alanyl-D-glutamate--2,6-diaminopimelate ligase
MTRPSAAVAVAVTGTNGKTSVVNFTRQIWACDGRQAASLGTIGLVAPGRVEPGSLTTPDPVTLHRTLAELADARVTHVAFEASSQGLDQYRLDGVRLSAAAFTNLTRDHLDYHGGMEAYWRSKCRLFDAVMAPGGTAVINAASDMAEDLIGRCRQRGHVVLTFGPGQADIRLDNRVPSTAGQDLVISIAQRVYQLHLPLAGSFQADNALAALGLALATGMDPDRAVEALTRLDVVPGRLQKVATTPAGATVLVDYAHTPDGLETALKALRPHTRGRLVVVFGCGGDRDKGKRPMMGRIAAELADRVIVTDDNPRTEDAATIRQEVMAACPGARNIGDRTEAIREAVAGLAAGDLLVVAGKGHEQGQIVGTTVLPFDDVDVARRAVEALS